MAAIRNSVMIRTFVAFAAVAAIASPAAAAVKINVAGKDAATVHALVARAAEVACRDELRGSVLAFRAQGVCVEAAQQEALEKIAKAGVANYAQLAY